MNNKMSIYHKSQCTLSTELTTMTSHNVDLLLKPFNDGKNTLLVLKLDDQIFVYDKKGLYVFPVVRHYVHFTILNNVYLCFALYDCVGFNSTYWRYMDKSRTGTAKDGRQCCRCSIQSLYMSIPEIWCNYSKSIPIYKSFYRFVRGFCTRVTQCLYEPWKARLGIHQMWLQGNFKAEETIHPFKFKWFLELLFKTIKVCFMTGIRTVDF